jgi:hypothetical protein
MEEWMYIHVFFTSALVGGDWSASRPGRFTLGEIAPGTHWIGGCVNTSTKWRSENFCLYRDSNSDPLVLQPVASRYTVCAIPALHIGLYTFIYFIN